MNAKIPLEKGEVGPRLESITSAYAEYGAGGQAQLVLAIPKSTVDFYKVTLLPEE
ncbi:hypothetical protein [Caballeronia mineralivorans]|uniref:hypothetical protein n=1 Tax=Caballeronia mineralivorans TaxID=2010198 RepID=UPI000A61357E|nr:hypothetical protein [Caballeronia mineralivorans]